MKASITTYTEPTQELRAKRRSRKARKAVKLGRIPPVIVRNGIEYFDSPSTELRTGLSTSDYSVSVEWAVASQLGWYHGV